MTDRPIDTLHEFHMQHPDDAAFALIAHLIIILEQQDQVDMDQTWRNITNLLGDVEANRVLHAMCRIDHIDYFALLGTCQDLTSRHITARLLLHLAVLPISFVAGKLQIDQYWANKLLEAFNKEFTIDDPILWLKSYLAITEEERMRYSKAKHDLLLGRETTATPVDSAEYRRQRRRYLQFKPPDHN